MKEKGTITFDNGNTYVGELQDNKMHGQGTLTYDSGTKYIGEFKNNKKHGKGTVIHADGGKIVGEWKDGIPQEKNRLFFDPDGKEESGKESIRRAYQRYKAKQEQG